MAQLPGADSTVSRRTFLSGTVTGVAAGAAAALGRAPALVSAQGATREMRTDVVVCGTGLGGMTAAVRAQMGGARVMLLEKSYEPGGTTAHSEGGVVDRTFEEMQWLGPDGDPVVQRTISENVPRFYQFCEQIGAPLSAPQKFPGMSRGIRWIPPVAFINFMVSEFEDRGGTLLVETPMLRLLTNRELEVIGVLAEGPQGLIRIFAKAVVLATGGWAGNAQMVTAHITRHFSSLHQRNTSFGGRKPNLMGDGYHAAAQIGGAPSVAGWDGFYGHGMPARPTDQMQNPLANYSLYHGPDCVAVNLYGRRFTDEALGRLRTKIGAQPAEQHTNQEVARQPEATAAYIWDERVDKERACADCGLGDLDKYPAWLSIKGTAAMADTLEGLVQQMERWNRGMSAEVILREVTEYNQAASNGKAWALPIPKGIDSNAPYARPIVLPPFRAVLMQTGITSTFGGIRANESGQVLARTGHPIRGLFAAGVDVGGFSTYQYNGNLCMGAGYGYVSGGNAAKQPEPRGGWELGPLSPG